MLDCGMTICLLISSREYFSVQIDVRYDKGQALCTGLWNTLGLIEKTIDFLDDPVSFLKINHAVSYWLVVTEPWSPRYITTF